MTPKTEQLQIRLTPDQKAKLKAIAASAGLDVSSYVLGRALPPKRARVEVLLDRLAARQERRAALAELNDLLTEISGPELADALENLDVDGLTSLDQNYVAAMVEEAAYRKSVRPPRWTAGVSPLDKPYFTTPLPGLRLHLLRESPPAFKRRNLFVDSSLGARV